MAESLSEQLLASREAGAGRDGRPCSMPVEPCPLRPNEIEVTLRTADGSPVAEQEYELIDFGGTRFAGRSDALGLIRLSGLRSGPSLLRLVGLHKEAWDGEESSSRPGRAALDHPIAAGESLVTVARRHGFLAETIWDHPRNRGLRERRPNPDLLVPGDVVHIPAIEEKEVSLPGHAALTLTMRGPDLELLRLRLVDERGEPRTQLTWMLEVDGALTTGSTDMLGGLVALVPVHALFAKLTLRGEDGDETEILSLRQLLPIELPLGQRQRLTNLGYMPAGGALRPGLQAFQNANRLSPTGEADARTLAKLADAHGR